MWTVASLKICTLMCYFREKYIMFDSKKYRVVCHNSKKWYKIWGGTDLCFEKWHQEFGKYWPNAQKSQNLQFNGLILPTYVMFELTNYRGVMYYYTEDRCKVWRKNELSFINHMGNMVNFTGALKNLKINTLRYFLSKLYNVWAQNLQGSYVSWDWSVVQYSKNNLLLVWKIT